MNMWSWILSVIAAAFIMLLLVAVVFGWGIQAIANDCDHFGKFRNSERVYECRLVADYTEES
ncbi:hypothetical protein D3C81_170040 [compost metagenome]